MVAHQGVYRSATAEFPQRRPFLQPQSAPKPSSEARLPRTAGERVHRIEDTCTVRAPRTMAMEVPAAPMSLESQDQSALPPVLSDPAAQHSQQLASLLNASVPPEVLARIHSAIQLGSTDPLAYGCLLPHSAHAARPSQYIRAYRLPPNAAFPPLLASLLHVDPTLELLWLGPPDATTLASLPPVQELVLPSVKPPQPAQVV